MYSLEVLDWEEEDRRDRRPDVVLGADIVFDPRISTALVSTIGNLLRKEGSRAIICSTVRNNETYNCFLTGLKAALLKWTNVDYVNSDNVHIIQIERQKADM